LKAGTDDLERKIGADDSGDRLASTLNNISMHMSGLWAANSDSSRRAWTCTI
jgi:hypothetical protein